MTGGQVAALIFAILLLFPGGCFLLVGIGTATDPHYRDIGGLSIIVGLVILGVMGLLFRFAFRKRRPPPAGGAVP
jgi:divalent metal cation (Fe/Co/Zn/Cd) transporter